MPNQEAINVWLSSPSYGDGLVVLADPESLHLSGSRNHEEVEATMENNGKSDALPTTAKDRAHMQPAAPTNAWARSPEMDGAFRV